MLLTHEAVAIGRKRRATQFGIVAPMQRWPPSDFWARKKSEIGCCSSPLSATKKSLPPSPSPHAQNINRDLHAPDDVVARLRIFEHEQGKGIAEANSRPPFRRAKFRNAPGQRAKKKLKASEIDFSRGAKQGDRGRSESDQRRSGTDQSAKRESGNRGQAAGERRPDRGPPETGGGCDGRRGDRRGGGRFA